MSYEIRTIEYHENAIKNLQEQAARRFESQVDVGDSAMSSWANDNSIQAHRLAISLLEKGLEIANKEVPYSDFLTLVDNDGNTVSSQLSSREYYGTTSYFWVLNDEMTEKYGRRFIPSSNRSRIQKELGLKEDHVLEEAKGYLVGNCAGIGLPVSYYPVRNN